jgi:hypothetical protein
MVNAAIAARQTVRECHWSRPGLRRSGVTESLQPESLWVCVRTGGRQDVTDATCESCPHCTDLASRGACSVTASETIRTETAAATLHSPWDCRWGQFGQRSSETFWVCTFATLRTPIVAAGCERCPGWDFLPPLEALVAADHDRAK